MAVLSEFLYRSINVAIPEVDVGDDIFVVKEKDETVTRVQAKYAIGVEQANGSYVTQFMLPWEQFDQLDDKPPLVYVLAVRHYQRWNDFLVIRRGTLRELQYSHGIGSVALNRKKERVGLKLRFVFFSGNVTGRGGLGLQCYRNAFLPWPPLLTETLSPPE